jgi:hypothetical protein
MNADAANPHADLLVDALIAFIQTTTARLNKERFEGGLIYDLAGRASASESSDDG